MKKVTVILSLLVSLFMLMPSASADVEKKDGTIYGTIKVDKGGWVDNPAVSGGKKYTAKYYVTKTNKAGYVYITLKEELNVKINEVYAGSAFTLVKKGNIAGNDKDGYEVAYVFKLKNGTSISSETELMTVDVNIVDPTNTNCSLPYNPKGTTCENYASVGIYFDKNGNFVTTQDKYDETCAGSKPSEPIGDDEPNNPKTGNAVPYIAVGGGLLAIVGVYLFSRKSNKMYKL